jgi:hypothetical protein
VNGIVLSVTANLEVALRALAANNEFQGYYKIWIDAICINQIDEVERASQVSKMREIYNGSWTVISWLGKMDRRGDMGKAFRFLRNMASLTLEEQDLARVMTQRPGFIEDSSFFALHEMMTRPYWSRLWVIQEVIMGASSTVLRCGVDWLDWNTFCAGIAVLYNGNNWNLKDVMLFQESEKRGLHRDCAWHTLSLHLVHQDLRPLSRYEDQGGERLGFRQLLEIASSTACRDVCDKVFALIGMMEPGIANEVVRNYGLGSPRLFAAVTKAFILHYNNLEPLRQGNPWGEWEAQHGQQIGLGKVVFVGHAPSRTSRVHCAILSIRIRNPMLYTVPTVVCPHVIQSWATIRYCNVMVSCLTRLLDLVRLRRDILPGLKEG